MATLPSTRILAAVKKHALSRGTIACVGEVATLNVTRGCGARCAFCHARCYAGAPPSGTVLLYQDLPALLRHELDRRKRPAPRFAVLASACDAFIGGPAVQNVTIACIEILLRRGIGVSFSTRGVLPPEAIQLLGHYRTLVHVTVPLASMSTSYHEAWEQGTALPQQRLFLTQQLQRVGIRPSMHIEPIIPFVNDGSDDLRAVVSALVGMGLDQAYASFLHLRPGVAEQLQRDAPAATRRLVLGCFPSARQGRPSGFDHLPVRQTLAGLRRLQRIAREHGLRVSACRCQNPGLPASSCPVVPPELPVGPTGGQAELFDSDD